MQLIEHVLKGGQMDDHKNTMKVYYGSIDSYHANKSATTSANTRNPGSTIIKGSLYSLATT